MRKTTFLILLGALCPLADLSTPAAAATPCQMFLCMTGMVQHDGAVAGGCGGIVQSYLTIGDPADLPGTKIERFGIIAACSGADTAMQGQISEQYGEVFW